MVTTKFQPANTQRSIYDLEPQNYVRDIVDDNLFAEIIDMLRARHPNMSNEDIIAIMSFIVLLRIHAEDQ